MYFCFGLEIVLKNGLIVIGTIKTAIIQIKSYARHDVSLYCIWYFTQQAPGQLYFLGEYSTFPTRLMWAFKSGFDSLSYILAHGSSIILCIKVIVIVCGPYSPAPWLPIIKTCLVKSL